MGKDLYSSKTNLIYVHLSYRLIPSQYKSDQVGLSTTNFNHRHRQRKFRKKIQKTMAHDDWSQCIRSRSAEMHKVHRCKWRGVEKSAATQSAEMKRSRIINDPGLEGNAEI